jgi:hypothetical protein
MNKCNNTINEKYNTKKSCICHQNLYCKLKPNKSDSIIDKNYLCPKCYKKFDDEILWVLHIK